MRHHNIYKLIHPMKFEENSITKNISMETEISEQKTISEQNDGKKLKSPKKRKLMNQQIQTINQRKKTQQYQP